jgi:HAMP domain-containing protein
MKSKRRKPLTKVRIAADRRQRRELRARIRAAIMRDEIGAADAAPE